MKSILLLSSLSFLSYASIPDYQLDVPCKNDFQCGDHGECVPFIFNTTENFCVCDDNVINLDNEICNYKQTSQLVAFLLSFFLGYLGIDRCYMSRGDGTAICIGIFKAITLGCLGIWWLIDWILILADPWNDGNGVPLHRFT